MSVVRLALAVIVSLAMAASASAKSLIPAAGIASPDGRIQVELAGFDQLHNRHAGHRFANRGDLERCLGHH